MDVTGEEIDPCHQGQGAVALVFVIAHYSRAFARQGWAIRRGRRDRLDPGFLVIRDDGEAPAAVFALVLLTLRLPTQHRDLPVDTEDFGHLGLLVTFMPKVTLRKVRCFNMLSFNSCRNPLRMRKTLLFNPR